MVTKNFAVTNAPSNSAAVDNNNQNFIVGNARFEAVDKFATCHFRQRLRDLRHDAARNVDDFVTFTVGNERQRSAEAAAARLNDNRFIISHCTHLLSRFERLAQRNALLLLDVSRAEVRDSATNEIDYDTDKQIVQCKVDVIQSERRYAVCNAEINEQLTGIDVREQSVERVATTSNEKPTA